MCGIVGFFGEVGIDNESNILMLENMTNSMISRGPDDCGTWFDNINFIGLGHRRLSILDLSILGHQPMISFSGRYVIVFNGEIYNHLSLRDELKGMISSWKSSSDTETLLSSFEVWGIEKTISKCVGMFAFAVFDTVAKKLVLGRDRFGEKPLYYGWQGSGSSRSFVFSSELKALKKHSSFENKLSLEAISLFAQYSYIPSPLSIYEGIYKLEAGNLLCLDIKSKSTNKIVYWNINEVVHKAKSNQFSGNVFECVKTLEDLLIESLKGQMLSDVPLGAFLSGGIDSSLIVSLMASLSTESIKTFTIGFDNHEFNEAKKAKKIAKFLNTEHTEMYLSDSDALNVVPKLSQIYCEPFADSSQIPTILVSTLAKTKVSVSLSGDGGDELFAGYNRYSFIHKNFKKISRLNPIFKNVFEKSINYLGSNSINTLFKFFPHNNMGEKASKIASIINKGSLYEMYKTLLKNSIDPIELLNSYTKTDFDQLAENHFLSLTSCSDIEKMMLLDSIYYMSDDILAKVDRAAMSVSLETRVPYLDHRVFEFAWTLPFDYKIRNNKNKFVLRELLKNYLPTELFESPKKGFAVPISDWLRTSLYDWTNDLLAYDKIKAQGIFNVDYIVKIKNEHFSLKKDWGKELWTILMFQSWIENQ